MYANYTSLKTLKTEKVSSLTGHYGCVIPLCGMIIPCDCVLVVVICLSTFGNYIQVITNYWPKQTVILSFITFNDLHIRNPYYFLMFTSHHTEYITLLTFAAGSIFCRLIIFSKFTAFFTFQHSRCLSIVRIHHICHIVFIHKCIPIFK